MSEPNSTAKQKPQLVQAGHYPALEGERCWKCGDHAVARCPEEMYTSWCGAPECDRHPHDTEPHESSRLRVTNTAPASPTTSAIRAAAREWMNTHHASFKTLREREDALVAIIARYLGREDGKGIEP